MTFHLLSLPHTQITKDYSACAYTEKVRKFANMMTDRGHKVYVYASEDNESKGELVTCITKAQQAKYGFKSPEDYLKVDFSPTQPYWQIFLKKAIKEIGKRIQPKDFILLSMGITNLSVKQAFPANLSVEYGIGYYGVLHEGFRVFESYIWRNHIYGRWQLEANFYDEVVPNYFEAEDFPFSDKKDDYYLYIGRLIPKKGYNIAIDACKRSGKKLIIAGQGNLTDEEVEGLDYEYRGMVGPKERGELMSRAQAVFVPTTYVEPFGGVHIEAQLCGTPVITTDFGIFSDTVVNGVNGYRCKMMRDFIGAMEDVKGLDYTAIRHDAIMKYSLEAVGVRYEEYFERLNTLWAEGFYIS